MNCAGFLRNIDFYNNGDKIKELKKMTEKRLHNEYNESDKNC